MALFPCFNSRQTLNDFFNLMGIPVHRLPWKRVLTCHVKLAASVTMASTGSSMCWTAKTSAKLKRWKIHQLGGRILLLAPKQQLHCRTKYFYNKSFYFEKCPLNTVFVLVRFNRIKWAARLTYLPGCFLWRRRPWGRWWPEGTWEEWTGTRSLRRSSHCWTPGRLKHTQTPSYVSFLFVFIFYRRLL